jgi:hypothetical protein
MPSPIAEHLVERFASDARALRARADALAAVGRAGRGAARPPGPTAESTLRMAAACDRVQALFAEAADDEAARALLPALAGLVAGAPTEDERYVYAGAVARLTDALDGDDEDHDDDLDDADDVEEDDEA